MTWYGIEETVKKFSINLASGRVFYCKIEIILLIYDDKTMTLMTLQINLGQSDVELKLLKNGAALDLQTAKYYHDLSDVLISCLDKLLIRNNIDIKSLKIYKIQSDLGENSTSHKIAAVFVEGLKI